MDLSESVGRHRFHLLGDGKRGRVVGKFLDPLGDMPRKVSHALQVAADLQDGGNPSEIRGHRLVQGKDFQALALELVFPAIDGARLAAKLIGKIDPPITKGVNAAVQHVLDNRGELENSSPESLQVAEEVASEHHPLAVPAGP
ncbi:MAG: hypothetical protein NVSMB9_06110 [Isosphaeraceae bacterium]